MALLDQRTAEAIRKNEAAVLADWNESLAESGALRDNRLSADELGRQTSEFLQLLVASLASGDARGLSGSGWDDARQFLEKISHSRAVQGFDSAHTANFIFSLKRPLFSLVQREYKSEPEQLGSQLWETSALLDSLGMHTIRTFQKSREGVIKRQQEELLELSTPVVKLWDGVLALPMIGTLDSQRTQVVMESLLQRIVETGSEIAIIDITGVPTVDTLVAQHLLKTVTAIRLMGADCIISGVRPQIAQTIVHLGLDLQGIVTKANLADALALALKRNGLTVTKAT